MIAGCAYAPPRVGHYDVIIPAYNAERWLAGAVASARHVPGLGTVRVVDDGSREPIEAWLPDQLAREDPEVAHKVELVRQANAGPGPARNTAIERALADPGLEAVVFVDADDELTAGIADGVALLGRLGAATVSPNRLFAYDDGRERTLELPEHLRDRALDRPGAMFGVHVPVFGGSGLVLSRRVLDAGLRFDPAFRTSQDVDLIRRAGEVGPIAVCSSVGVRVRRRYTGNQTGLDNLETMARCHILLADRHFEPSAEAVWRERWAHMIRTAAKRWHDPGLYRLLAADMHARGWRVPPKARYRHACALVTGGYARRRRAFERARP